MVPDTAMDLGFHYFSSQMRYSSMFRNALSNMSGRLTNVASIAASARIHVNNMRTHFERSNVFESERIRSPRSRLEVYSFNMIYVNESCCVCRFNIHIKVTVWWIVSYSSYRFCLLITDQVSFYCCLLLHAFIHYG